MKRVALASAALTLAVACQETAGPPILTPASQQPSFATAAAGEAIPGQYIVVFRESVTDVHGTARELLGRHGGTLRHTYTSALKGFSAGQLSEQAANAIAADARVAYVEQNQVMRAITEQTNATWGIDRVDQRDLPLSTTYVYSATGQGVDAYIIDTGIRTTHSEFVGRAFHGTDKVDNDNDASDCNGHGTHVAGTVGGTVYGVAKSATLYAVRVLDCGGSGTNDGVIAGVDWVTGHHTTRPAVANMSLGGGFSQALNDAVARSVADGVVYAVAAGNGYGNACDGSPASEASAMTIGATDSNDNEASYSDRGSCLDIWAPGSSITSAWHTGDNATNTISGTSMATPHVAGAAALYLEGNTSATPAEVDQALSDNATTGKIKWNNPIGWKPPPPPAGQDYLLYTGFVTGGPPLPPPPPPADPTTLTATTASKSQINLSWTDNADNESGFKIERCQGDGCTNFAQIGTTGANTTSFSDTGLNPSTMYRYRVRAYNSGGNSSYTNEAQATTHDNLAPQARYTWSCSGKGGRVCNFNGSGSNDPDGSVSSHRWNLGDGTTRTGAQVQHTYSSRGAYTVTLTVTDNNGATDSRTCSVQTGTSGSCE